LSGHKKHFNADMYAQNEAYRVYHSLFKIPGVTIKRKGRYDFKVFGKKGCKRYKPLSKLDIIRSIQDRYESHIRIDHPATPPLGDDAVDLIITYCFSVILDALVAGDRVVISDFGSFFPLYTPDKRVYRKRDDLRGHIENIGVSKRGSTYSHLIYDIHEDWGEITFEPQLSRNTMESIGQGIARLLPDEVRKKMRDCTTRIRKNYETEENESPDTEGV